MNLPPALAGDINFLQVRSCKRRRLADQLIRVSRIQRFFIRRLTWVRLITVITQHVHLDKMNHRWRHRERRRSSL